MGLLLRGGVDCRGGCYLFCSSVQGEGVGPIGVCFWVCWGVVVVGFCRFVLWLRVVLFAYVGLFVSWGFVSLDAFVNAVRGFLVYFLLILRVYAIIHILHSQAYDCLFDLARVVGGWEEVINLLNPIGLVLLLGVFVFVWGGLVFGFGCGACGVWCVGFLSFGGGFVYVFSLVVLFAFIYLVLWAFCLWVLCFGLCCWCVYV